MQRFCCVVKLSAQLTLYSPSDWQQSKSVTCLSSALSLFLSPLYFCVMEWGKCRKGKGGEEKVRKYTVMDPLALVAPVRLTVMEKWRVRSPWGCLERTSCLSFMLFLSLSLSWVEECDSFSSAQMQNVFLMMWIMKSVKWKFYATINKPHNPII